MYAGARRRLGETVLSQSTVDIGSDGLPIPVDQPIDLNPTVVITPGQGGGDSPQLPPAPLYGPESIGPTIVPQTLPPLVSNAPASAGLGAVLLWGAVALFATDELTRTRRR